ncbi:MAG: tyrosine-type recombinase/integrase [Xanthobacteraceae bacterium]
MPLTLVPPKAGRTPNWHIRGTHLRVPVNRSAGTPDKSLAKKIKASIEREIEAGTFTVQGDGLTFLAAAVAYMKAGGDRTFLGPIIEYNGTYQIRDRPVAIITQQDLDHLADALCPNAKPQTRNRKVYTPVIAVLHYADIERKFRRPKGWQGKKSRSSLTPEQAFALLNECEAIDREFGLLCYTLLYTGRRISETLNAKLRDLNLSRSTLYLRNTKNGEPVTVHLPPILTQKFLDMPPRPIRPTKATAGRRLRNGEAGSSQIGAGIPFLKRDPDQRIFRSHKGGYLRNLLAMAMNKVGLSFPWRERGFHLFCHTYATWMMIFGKLDNYALARTGRWKDPRSPEGYLHTAVSSEARMADVLPTPTRAKSVRGWLSH